MSVANQEQADAWNGDNGLRWVADADRRDRVLQPVADVLFEAARFTPGETVLDIGCGCGITTLGAADAVSPGTATGIDLSAPMLDVARRRAATRADVTFLHADAQTRPFAPAAFDVAISRFGTMFFDDPVVAFANIATAMCPGGRLCIATWQPLTANDWLAVPGAALLRFGSLPEMGGNAPGMFAQSAPSVVADVLHAAGWRDVDVTPVATTLLLGADPAEAARYLADSGPGRAVLGTIDEPDRPAAIAAVIDTLAVHHGHHGVALGAAILLIQARVKSGC
ncbi:MAG: methyltransferase domain-containing protein [Actinobacteria bacterium]|nr:MAG: methyltransferase domain-containing protein [Actinomycetota bacterium]